MKKLMKLDSTLVMKSFILKKILKDEIISLTDATLDKLRDGYQPDNGAWDVKVILDRTYKDL